MEPNRDNESQDRVSRDTLYSQMSDTAMRHRNYEKEIAAWYTTILTAMFGFVLSTKFGAFTPGIAQLLSENILGRVIFAVVVLSIAFSSCWSIRFFHIQHTCFDRYVDTLLEPEEVKKKTIIMKKRPKLKPSYLMIVVQTLIASGTVLLIIIKP